MLLEICNLYGGYDGKDIVQDVCCRVEAGEILCLVGPNGCGKTTLFRLILGLEPITNGQIYIQGQEIGHISPKEMARAIAYIPQYHEPIFSYTVLDMVMMGRLSHVSSLHTPKSTDREAAFAALEQLGIAHLTNQNYTLLSGGQRQMVLIARAICQSAKMMIMDEPSANLDYANQQLLMEVITDLAQQGYSIIMSTHNPEHPLSFAHKVMLMQQGKVAAFGAPDTVITPQVLEQVYGIEMDVVSVLDRYGVLHKLCLPVKNPMVSTQRRQSHERK